MKPIKVQHLSTSERIGGAARAANRLHKCFLENEEKKIFSSMRVSRKTSDEKEIKGPKQIFSNKLRCFISNKLNLLSNNDKKTIRSYSFLPSFISNEINKSIYDLVHLHWVQGEFISIEAIGKIRKPLIWTFHDTWPFCGGEHYPLINDFRYKEGYLKSNRPKYENKLDLDRWCWNRKVKAWSNLKINIVTPSKWMAELASNSIIMKNQNITVIPNPIPTDIFKPFERKESRAFFKLPQNKKFLLFGAASGISDPRKGWDIFVGALERLKSYKELEIIVLGESNILPKYIKGFKLNQISNLKNDFSIAKLYSASDIVVVPSRLDNFPQLITEAQSCGTPVVTFNSSGLKECIENLETGFLANPQDYESLANGIKWILKSKERYCKLSENSRKFALKNWSYEIVYKQFKDFYYSILQSKY